MSIGKRLRFEVFKRDQFTCQYCGAKAPDVVLEVDHIHPRARGGRDALENLRTACRACNAGKSDVPVLVGCQRWLLLGGPLGGTWRESSERHPFLWVFQRASGEIFGIDDAWQWDETTDAEASPRTKYRAPWHRSGERFAEWDNGTRPLPHLLGCYWAEYEDGPVTMRWRTVEDLLVEVWA